jgi:tetratricopeptide (TPR) repeat protein
MSIPEGLRDVIGKRLSLLSPECNSLLSVASVIGRDFALVTLRGVVDISEEAFVKALKEAVGLSVLEERPQVGAVRYRFTHAFFRQTLYEEMIAPQRLQLHQQIARTLEKQYQNRLEEHATELAEHFSHSSNAANLKKAVKYGEMAAQRAANVYAYGEAVRLLEQALKVQRVVNPDDKGKVCDLLLTLGNALHEAGQARRAFDVELPEAFALAETIGDRQRASRVCAMATTALSGLGAGAPWVWTSPETVQWLEQMDRYAEPDTVERVWVNMLMGYVRFLMGETREGIALMRRALDLARDLGDNESLSWTYLFSINCVLLAPQHAKERLHLTEELVALPRAGLRQIAIVAGLNEAVLALLDSGQRQRAEERWRELREVAERTGHVYTTIISAALDSILTTIDGRLEEAGETARGILARGEETGATEFAALFASVAGYWPWLLLGKADEALQLIKTSVPFPHAEALCLAHLGRDTEVAEILERNVVNRPGVGTTEDETSAREDIMYLEAAVLVKHRQAAELLLGRFAGDFPPLVSYIALTCTARHLGAAAALLGRPDEARKYYQEALKVATEVKFRPEVALTRLQLAELLLEHYPDEKAEAREHLNFAIKEFREMKMRPSLERALRHKDILKA